MASPEQKSSSRLQKRIEDKSFDLFKERAGVAPLHVLRIYKGTEKDEEDEEIRSFEDGDIFDISQLTKVHSASNNTLWQF